jgi:hypothetical protein
VVGDSCDGGGILITVTYFEKINTTTIRGDGMKE